MRLGWVIAYSAGLFVASVVALPCWNAFLRDSVGRFLTVEQIHVVEYAGLGGVAAFTCRRATRSWRRIIGLVVLVAAVGFLDEALQVFLPHRYFQWSDVLLNWLGLVVGGIVAGSQKIGGVAMNQKTFNTLAGVVFVVVAVLHLFRFLFRWEAVIGGWAVPTWVSALALVLSGYLALSAFKLSK